MARAIADVEIAIRAQTDVLDKDLAKGKASVNRFAKDVENSFLGTGKSLEKGLGALRSTTIVAGVTAIGAALTVATGKALDFGSEIVDTAGKLGITTDALQELRFAASQAGVSTQSLDASLEFLNRNASQAAGKNKQAADAFRRLGVDFKDANGEIKQTDQLFTEVIGRLGELSSVAERTDISRQLLGRGGNELGKLAREGADGIEVLRAEARALGLVIDNETLLAAERAGDQFEALGNILSTQSAAAILEFSGELNSLAASLIEATRAAQEFFDEFRKPQNAKTTEGIVEGIAELEERIARLRRQQQFPGGGRVPNQEGIAAELKRAEDNLRDLQERLRQRTVGGASPGSLRSAGSTGLLAPRDEAAEKAGVRAAEKEAARAAREEAERSAQAQRESAAAGEKVIDLAERRLQAEMRLAEAAGDTDAANEKRVELIQRRFELERAEILRTVQDAELSQRALEDLGATRDAQLAEVASDATDAFTELKDFAIDGLSDALADLAITGELTFKSLGEAFLREFIQVAIKEGVAKLGKALAGLDTGGSGAGGVGGFLSLFGLASGGVVTRPTIAMIGEAGPEAVIPLDRLGGGGGNVEITIMNNGSGQARLARQERSGSDVKLLFEIVDAEFADRASRGGSKFVKSLTQNYGLSRRGERNG